MRENQIKKLGNYHFVGKTLGKGHFGFVELALHTLTNIKVAVKITEIHGEKAAIVRRNCCREVSTLNKLNHPCIVKIHETFKTKNTCCLVMEYVDGGDLLTFVREKAEGKLVEEDARWYFEQIVSVLDYLHQRRIVHRDLKMENILLQGADKKMVKVIDFGLSNVFSKGEFLSTKCGSPEYAAPELFRRDCKYGTEVDVWSLGIILYGMLVGQLPFRNGNYGKLVCLISKGLTSVHQEKMKNLNAECVVLLSNILQPESSRRYTIQNIIAHPWLCSGRNKLAIFRSPDVDRATKQKLIKATADMMELSRTEVSIAVESRQCDSIFAVYNILLQEELKQNNSHATKTVASVVIRDHSNTVRLAGGTAEKRRRMNENEAKSSRNILQKSRLRSTQAKRLWTMKKRAQNSERKTFDGVSCVIGTSIGRPATERNSTDRNEVEKEPINNHISKEVIENGDRKCNDLSEMTCKNIVEQTSIHNETSKTEAIDQTDLENLNAGSSAKCQVEESLTDGQTTDKQDDLKTGSEESESDVTLNGNDTFWYQDNFIASKPSDHIHDVNQDVSLNETSCEKYVRAPASLADISDSTSSDSLEGIGGHASTTVDKITESPIATPSLAASSISNILSLIADEQCHNGQVWMDVDNNDLACTSEYNEVQSGIQNIDRSGAACVTLQVIDVKKKCPVQQKFVGRARFKSAERKGSVFSTIPTKKTVNPSKDLEEAIEERLKPCLKNSAASLRERPHTASSKISRKSFRSESDMCVSNDLPPRPKTVASSQPRGGGLQVKSSNPSTQDKSLTAALRARRATRKNGPRPKVDSWLKHNDSTFQISGKKIHVEGSSELDENSGKTSETQQHGTIIVPSRIPADSSATKISSETKDTSSINLVVGTGCFKKDKETKSIKEEDEASMMNDTRELTDSNSEITDFVTAWLSKLEIDPTKAEKSGSMESFQNDVNNCAKCRNGSASSRNRSDKSSWVCKVPECKAKREVRFCSSDIHRSDRSSRMYKSSKESLAAKWDAVEKFICTGQKMNAWTREQIVQSGPVTQTQNENVQTEARVTPVCVPSVTISVKPQLVAPSPSIDTLKSGDEFDGAGGRERMLVKKYYQNSSRGFIDGLQKKSRTGKQEYWNQMTSSELEKDKLVMGSKEWMDAHLTAVLDKAKMTRELCQMG